MYVVVGGASGIGAVWSEYVIRHHQAQVVWIGRRALDVEIQLKIDALAAIGPAPLYLTADAGNLSAMQEAHRTIRQRYGQIHGVVHSAIVLLDQGLARMSEERFQAALSAKIDVSIQMKEVFGQEPLDFVLFFSSIQSFAKAAGQSNYAAGSTFKDAFAHYWSRQTASVVRVMNWGYWGSVGIVASADYQARMAQSGLISIEAGEGMTALELFLAGPLPQMALVKRNQSWSMAGVNGEVLVSIYPAQQKSFIEQVRQAIPDQHARIEQVKTDVGLQTREMDELLGKLLFGQLQSIGMFTEKGTLPIAELKARARLRPLYDRWFEETLAVLQRQGFLTSDGTHCTVRDAKLLDLEMVWKEWDWRKSSWLNDPNKKAQVILVETTVWALTEILTGKIPATDVMFPNSSLELVEGVYKKNRTADYFNEVLADTIVAYVQERISCLRAGAD